MRYFDCTKFDYKKLGKKESKELIKRDKLAYKHSLLSWVEDEIDSIVERKWEIDNIGVVEETGAFIKLIKEAELSYSLGAYYSAISLIGVASEDLCKYFSNMKKHSDLIDVTQFVRINELKCRGVIDESLSNEFHFIRVVRNDCLHFNDNFKGKEKADIKSDALLCINKLKLIYKNLFSSLNSAHEKGELISKVIEDFAKQKAYNTSFGDTLNEEEFAMKLRYFMADEFDLDLAIAGAGKRVTQNGIFRIDEIDLDMTPKEMTVVHLASGKPFYVDLTEQDINHIKKNNIIEGEKIVGSIYSITNHQGMTAAWNFDGLYRIE